MEDSTVSETVAQFSYNTAYKALRGIRSANTESKKMEDTLCYGAMSTSLQDLM